MARTRWRIGVARGEAKGIQSPRGSIHSEYRSLLGGSTSNPNSSDVQAFNQSFVPVRRTIFDQPTREAQYAAGVNQLRGGKGALYVKAAGNGFSNMGLTNNVNCDRPFGPILAGLSCENANFDPSNAVPYNIVVGAVNATALRRATPPRARRSG